MPRRNYSTKVWQVFLVFLLIFGLNLKVWSQKRDLPDMPADVYDQLSQVTVKLICDDGEKIGSGVIVGLTHRGRALVLTACHVISTNFEETDPDIALEFHEKVEAKMPGLLQPVKTTIIPKMVDRANDLALILINVPIREENVVNYNLTDKVKPGQKVAATGYPKTDELSLTVGRVTRLENKYLVFDAKIATGSSGGALIDEKGRLIGISSFIAQSEEADEGYALSMNLVLSVVDVWLRQVKLKKVWQYEKDGSFFTSPWFIGGLAASTGAGVFFIASSGGGSGSNTFPLPVGRPEN